MKIKIKNLQKGVTIIEIAVVIVIVMIFSAILISDFPKIQRQFSISRAAYKLAQDMRRAQDLGLSGVNLKYKNGDPVLVGGYGAYVDLSQLNSDKQYIIYADVLNGATSDKRYNRAPYVLCADIDEVAVPPSDCVVDILDLKQINPYLYIKRIENINVSYTSINFSPPNPFIDIDNLTFGFSEMGIVLGLSSDPELEREVWINTSGLIKVQ